MSTLTDVLGWLHYLITPENNKLPTRTGMYAAELQAADLYDADQTPQQKLNQIERGIK